MSNAWSVSGKRIELKAGFPTAKLVVDGQVVGKPKTNADVPFHIDGRTYLLRTKQHSLQPVFTLVSPGGKTVPPSKTLTPRTFAPSNGMCAVHVSTQAAIVCARCGTFACSACSETDGTHCETCIAPMSAEHDKRQADMVLMAPALIFMLTGGALGGLIGASAGALAVFVARKIESKAMKWLAAIGIYFVAAIVLVISITLVRNAVGK